MVCYLYGYSLDSIKSCSGFWLIDFSSPFRIGVVVLGGSGVSLAPNSIGDCGGEGELAPRHFLIARWLFP